MNDIINSLKVSLLGTKSSDIDAEIDSSFKSIEKFSINSNRNKYVETIKNLISHTGIDSPEKIINNIQGPAMVQNYDQTGRLSRYHEFDSITRKISYCQRALETLTDNILSPDDITKRSVQYVISDEQHDKSEALSVTIARCKSIAKKIKLDEKIKRLVKTTLKKGDNFVEILLSPRGEHALTVIQENTKNNQIRQMGNIISKMIKYESINSNGENIENNISINVQLEYTPSSSSYMGFVTEDEKPNLSDDDRFHAKYSDKSIEATTQDINLSDVFIAIHDPKYIIRLETERFKSCLGYLVFPVVDPMIGQSSALMGAANQTVDGLCSDIILQLEKQLKTSNDKIKISDDLKKIILHRISAIQKNDDLKIRYVPPELMVHWRINQDTYKPYGESIFDCVNFDCRLLMALKTAKTIKQMSHATDKRVIAVETGLPRDAKNVIESIKEGISKKKISIDGLGSIDSIPSQIPTFETIYIPMRDGKKFVEIDNQQWGSNPQEDVENLKFIRDNIVANLGVPAPYLGLEENMCFSLDTMISLKGVPPMTLGQLIDEYENDPDNFNRSTFSIDLINNKTMTGKIISAKKTRMDAQMIRVYLSNGKFEDCTPDHQWMLHGGIYRQAQHLNNGDILQSLDALIYITNTKLLEERQDCGDLEIESYHNFYLASRVFVHNSNRSLLTAENINFCRTIISYQKELSIPLKELFFKIMSLVYCESADQLDRIEITFPEPKISPYEHQMEYVEQMQRLIEALKQLGVPMSWLKKKYLPNIDWDAVERYAAQDIIDKETGEERNDQDQMGGMY